MTSSAYLSAVVESHVGLVTVMVRVGGLLRVAAVYFDETRDGGGDAVEHPDESAGSSTPMDLTFITSS